MLIIRTYLHTIHICLEFLQNTNYEGHPINSGTFFIIRTLIRLAYQNCIVSMAKHVAHIIHYPKFISGQYLSVAKQPKHVSKKPLAR